MTKAEYLFEKLDKFQEQIANSFYKTLEKLNQQWLEDGLEFPIEIVTEEQQANQES